MASRSLFDNWGLKACRREKEETFSNNFLDTALAAYKKPGVMSCSVIVLRSIEAAPSGTTFVVDLQLINRSLTPRSHIQKVMLFARVTLYKLTWIYILLAQMVAFSKVLDWFMFNFPKDLDASSHGVFLPLPHEIGKEAVSFLERNKRASLSRCLQL